MVCKAVFDTNIFVAAAFKPGCLSAKLVEEAASGSVLLVWNRQTRREALKTIAKIPPIHRFPVNRLFKKEGRFDGKTRAHTHKYVKHVPDRKFAALATSAGAPLITRDSDLLGPRREGPALIFNPEEFLAWRDQSNE